MTNNTSQCLWACDLQDVQIAWDSVFTAQKETFSEEGSVLRAISANQGGIQFATPLSRLRSSKERVKLYFLKANCDTTDQECTDACDPAYGNSLYSGCEDYGFGNPICTSGSVPGDIEVATNFQTAEFRMKVMKKMEMDLLRKLEYQLLGFIDGQLNTAVDTTIGVQPYLIPNGAVYEYNPLMLGNTAPGIGADWFGYVFSLAADYGMTNPFFIHASDQIRQLAWVADKNSGGYCCNGRDGAKLADSPHYFAGKPVREAFGNTKKVSYLIDSDTIGLYTYRVFNATQFQSPQVTEANGKTIYGFSYQASGYSNVWINVEYTYACATGPNGEAIANVGIRAWVIPMFVARPNDCGRNIIALVPNCNAPTTADCPPVAAPALPVSGGRLVSDCRSGVTTVIPNNTVDVTCQPISSVTYQIDFYDDADAPVGTPVTITGAPFDVLPLTYGIGTYGNPTFNIPAILNLQVPALDPLPAYAVIGSSLVDGCGAVSTVTALGKVNIVCAECPSTPVEGTVFINC